MHPMFSLIHDVNILRYFKNNLNQFYINFVFCPLKLIYINNLNNFYENLCNE